MTNLQARLLEVNIMEESREQKLAFNGLLQAVKMNIEFTDLELATFERAVVMHAIEEVTAELVEIIKSVVAEAVKPAKHARKAKKVASGSLEFDTMITEDMFGDREARYQTAYITIKSNKLTADELYDLYTKATDIMLAELEGVVDCSVYGCPVEEAGYYGDGIGFDADHGSITEAKAEIKKAWKIAKAQLGLR